MMKTIFSVVQTKPYYIPSPVLLLGEAISSPYQPGQSKKSTGPDENLIAYFDDLYKFFLRKLTTVECSPSLSQSEESKLKAMLDELLRVKGMIVEESTIR